MLLHVTLPKRDGPEDATCILETERPAQQTLKWSDTSGSYSPTAGIFCKPAVPEDNRALRIVDDTPGIESNAAPRSPRALLRPWLSNRLSRSERLWGEGPCVERHRIPCEHEVAACPPRHRSTADRLIDPGQPGGRDGARVRLSASLSTVRLHTSL